MEKENTNTNEKKKLQNDFQARHAKDLSYVYVVNQTFKSVSNLFAKVNINKDRPPTDAFFCVCISSCSVDKKIAHCSFSIDKTKNKKVHLA